MGQDIMDGLDALNKLGNTMQGLRDSLQNIDELLNDIESRLEDDK